MLSTNLPHEHKWMIVLSAIVLVFLSVFLAFKSWLTFREAVQVGKPIPYEYTVNIEGVGTAYTKPDISKITFSLETKNTALENAQTENSTRMNALLDTLANTGVDRKDLQTTSYQTYEDQFYNNQDGTYRSLGWIVSQGVEVTLRDLNKVSAVLSLLGQQGVTKISGPHFAVEDADAVVQHAREEALADAKRKADTIARQLGITLGLPTNYNEWKEEVPKYGLEMERAMDATNPVVPPTIEPGQDTITLHVNVSYVIERS